MKCGKLKESVHLEDVGVDGRIILWWIFKVLGWKVVDQMHLAEDRDKRRAGVNMVMTMQVP
jgi:hypothetical protein